MNKKENRMAVRQEVQKSVIRDEQNRRIQFAATNPINEVLKNLHTTLRGLDEDAISVSRAKFGSNKVTHEKKKSLAKRLAGAFINPFTAILFCLAMVSAMACSSEAFRYSPRENSAISTGRVGRASHSRRVLTWSVP